MTASQGAKLFWQHPKSPFVKIPFQTGFIQIDNDNVVKQDLWVRSRQMGERTAPKPLVLPSTSHFVMLPTRIRTVSASQVNRYLSFLTLAIAVAVSTHASGQTASQKTLRGHVPSVVRTCPRLAGPPPSNSSTWRSPCHFGTLPPFQTCSPTSTRRKSVLSPRILHRQEFAAQFGPSPEQYEAVKRFAEKHGLQITATPQTGPF